MLQKEEVANRSLNNLLLNWINENKELIANEDFIACKHNLWGFIAKMLIAIE